MFKRVEGDDADWIVELPGHQIVNDPFTAIGGSMSPLLFGWLIESGSAWRVSGGYALAAALLLVAAGTELLLGIDAEGKSLESIADPLSSK
jgi:hypothetical protein